MKTSTVAPQNITFTAEAARNGLYAIEPELREHFPRRVRFTRKTNQKRCIFWCLLLAAPSLAFYVSHRSLQTWNALLHNGIQTDAAIVARADGATKQGEYTNFFYEFAYHGVRVTGSGSRYRADVLSGQKIPPIHVTFLPNDPHIYVTGTADPETVAARTLDERIAVGLLAITCLTLLVVIERRYRDLHELLRTGDAVIGHIDNERIEDEGVVAARLRYRYPISRKRDGVNDVAFPTGKRQRYASGKPLTILRDRQRPERSLPYVSLRSVVAIEDTRKR